MARKRSPAALLADRVDHALYAANRFLGRFSIVVGFARAYEPDANPPEAWRDAAFGFAEAFIAQEVLRQAVEPGVVGAIRGVYPPGAPSLRFGKMEPKASVLEVVEALAIHFRNAMYPGAHSPFDPDWVALLKHGPKDHAKRRAWEKGAEREARLAIYKRLGIKTHGDELEVMMSEWNGLDRRRAENALKVWRCESIDVAEIVIQLDREARGVIAGLGKSLRGQSVFKGSLVDEGQSALGLPKLFTVTEAANAYGLATYTVTRLANSGKLKSNGMKGRARRIDAASLTDLILADRKDNQLKRLGRFVN